MSARDSRRIGFSHARRRGARQAAFTLVELAVVCFIISLLGAIAVPIFKRITEETRSTAVINDLRVFSAAFQSYAHDRGAWPDGGSAPGEVPAGMEGYLKESNWSRPTPLGGLYFWAPNTPQQGERYRACIVLAGTDGNPVSDDRRQLEDLDRRIDDGNLSTGNLRLGYRDYPVYVIEH